MFSHVMVGTNDIERSKRFYDAVLSVLGAGDPLRNVAKTGHIRLFYRHDGSTFCVSEPINGDDACFANGGTIGFRCSSPEQVRQFHDTAVAHGGTSIEDPPGLREGSLGAMYLAALDPTAPFGASLLGHFLGVGLCEEMIKSLPVMWRIYRPDHCGWREACLWGMASGAGFGVSES